MKLLVANRGEIAVRVIRSAREMGIGTVAVYSEADRDGPWVHLAEEAVEIGPEAPAESYLSIPRLLAAARESGATAIHPGYGFLSENAGFAQACVDAGLTFVGPRPAAVAAMGDKLTARRIAMDHGVPVLPSVAMPDDGSLATLGLPILLKAAGGGGGKGMRVVSDLSRAGELLAEARAEAKRAFGDERVYAERQLLAPRHVEIQVLCDRFGGRMALGERECSIQRRHQKLIEETPSPAVGPVLRAELETAALKLCKAVGYEGVGTVEFLVEGGEFFFLEMNTRIQVEHPVTEMVTGLDLVREQLRVAMGEPLGPTQAARGHAIECRIIAEDPGSGFLPSPGHIRRLRLPQGPGIRVDAGVVEGSEIGSAYDPLLLKLVSYGVDREAARRRMVEALRALVVLGPSTTAELLRDICESPAFIAGETDTGFLGRFLPGWAPAADTRAMVAAWSVAAGRSDTSVKQREKLSDPWATLGGWRSA